MMTFMASFRQKLGQSTHSVMEDALAIITALGQSGVSPGLGQNVVGAAHVVVLHIEASLLYCLSRILLGLGERCCNFSQRGEHQLAWCQCRMGLSWTL